MKSPRDILLERHRAVEPKLNAARQRVLNNQATKELRRGGIPVGSFIGNLWQELIWPCRLAWAGMAVIWLAIVVANISMREPRQVSAKTLPSSVGTTMAFQQQQRLLVELIGAPPRQDAERPKVVLPQPRSERKDGWLVV